MPRSRRSSPALTAAGHDAMHVRDYGLATADDATILERARAEARVLVSADTDFGGLLARTSADSPSVVLLRRSTKRRPEEQASFLLAQLALRALRERAGRAPRPS